MELINNMFCSVQSLNRVQLFVTPWTIQSMEFSRPEYLGGLPFPSPGDLPSPGIEPRSPALQADSLPAEPQGKPLWKEGLLNHKKHVMEERGFGSQVCRPQHSLN